MDRPLLTFSIPRPADDCTIRRSQNQSPALAPVACAAMRGRGRGKCGELPPPRVVRYTGPTSVRPAEGGVRTGADDALPPDGGGALSRDNARGGAGREASGHDPLRAATGLERALEHPFFRT